MDAWHYFSKRWQAQVAFGDLFWKDLIVCGTLVNLLITFFGLMLIAQGYPSSWAVMMHFLVLPYNIFLVLAVLRWPEAKMWFKTSAGAWFVLTSLA